MEEESGCECSVVHSRSAVHLTPLFYHRVLLLVCAFAISAPVLFKSRSGRDNPARAAFSVPSSSRGYVRISGDVRHAGMYPLSANMVTIDAIKLAEPLSYNMDGIRGNDSAAYLANGMALLVTVRPNGTLLLSKSRMPVCECLVMGVPLDINAMSEADFDRVPGIGAKMAKRIAEYRQNNGGVMTVPDLLLINGIGEKKYKRMLKYFQPS